MKNLVFFFFVNVFLVFLTFGKSNADIKSKQYVDVVSVTSNGGIKACNNSSSGGGDYAADDYNR